MGLKGWLRATFGIEDLTQLIAAQQYTQREFLREVLQISALNAETVAKMTEIFDRLGKLYDVTEPPAPRHMSDELEAEIFAEWQKGVGAGPYGN